MKNASIIKRICAFALVLGIISSLGVSAVQKNSENSYNSEGNISDSGSVELNDNYSKYISSIGNYQYADSNIVLDPLSYSTSGNKVLDIKSLYGEENVLILNPNSSVTYDFSVKDNCSYNLILKYKIYDESGMNAKIGIEIDGTYPFAAAEEIEIPRMWADAGEFRKDDFGNQFSPEQTDYQGFVSKRLFDTTGEITEPYLFGFSKGNHQLTLSVKSGSIAILQIIISVPDKPSKYSDLMGEYERNGYKKYNGEQIVTEGENASIKNSNSIIPLSDNSSKIPAPSSSVKTLINYIGSTNWQNATDEITWEIDVPDDGLYKLGLMYKQDKVINGVSYRHIKIDGCTPFEEAAHIAFPYCIDWKFYEFSDENGDSYYFYLTKGKHELSMSVTMGETAEAYRRIKAVTTELGNLYIDIVMITGESPSANRDYELFKQIPDFMDILKNNYTELQNLADYIRDYTGKRSTSLVAAINNMSRVLNSMYENKYTAHTYVSDFYSNYVTLSSWLYEMTVMPLSIDQIVFAAPESDFEYKNVNFFEKMAFTFVKFLNSFSSGYLKVSDDKKNSESLKIWVNWGRDQAQVLNSLIQESFTTKTGISVDLEITNADLIKGMLSNNAPDLSLHLSRATPVNLAMRGALYDLSKFDDYEDVLKRFGESAEIPYQYDGGTYALPDQQSFYIMFYRTDIFERLNLEAPKTWDEFLENTAVLQRNNMEDYIPYAKITAANTTDVGLGGLNLYATVLMQCGGSVYNKEKNESLFTSSTSLQAFKYWTDMYTQYKIPTEMDFYNRFKVGTCPMGVTTYTTYTTLLQTAPEISDRWAIATVPGTVQSDGTVNSTVSGAGTGCSILNSSKNKEAAWEFLKWWTEADTQQRYNANVESILGAVSRVTTANVEAFSKMGWDSEDLKILLEERNNIKEIPEIPGSYYLSRSVDQAFWAVINGTDTVKDAVTKWGKEANEEIKRKISEYQGEEQ